MVMCQLSQTYNFPLSGLISGVFLTGFFNPEKNSISNVDLKINLL